MEVDIADKKQKLLPITFIINAILLLQIKIISLNIRFDTTKKPTDSSRTNHTLTRCKQL